MHGYTVAYEREEIQFPVYVVGLIGACLATIGFAIDNIFLIALSLLAIGFAYYNYPIARDGKAAHRAAGNTGSSPRAWDRRLEVDQDRLN